MKKSILFLLLFALMFQVSAQLPKIKLKDVQGNSVDVSQISNNGKPIIVSFWATWCKPCKAELNTIAEEFDDWVDETGVKLIAVSIDDARSA